MLNTSTWTAKITDPHPWYQRYGPLLLATIGLGYPVARIVLPGTAQPAVLIPLLLLFAWFAWQTMRPRALLRSPLGWPLLGCVIALLLSSMFGVAPWPEVAANLFDWAEGGVICFLVGYCLAAGWRPQVFGLAMLLASSLFLVVGTVDLLSWWAQWAQLWQPGMARLPTGSRIGFGGTHPNQAALLINLGVPLAIAAWWQARAAWQHALWAIWLLLATVMLYYTSSRGGWLAMVAISGTMVLPLLWSAWRRRRWRRFWSVGLLSALYGTLFLVLFVVNLQEIQAQRGRVPAQQPAIAPTAVAPTIAPTAVPTAVVPEASQPAESAQDSELAETTRTLTSSAGRDTFWQRALEFFAERPLLGVGPAGYVTRYSEVEPYSRVFVAPHAHNIYLQVLSESGLLGVGMLLVLGGVTLWIWWRGWQAVPPLLPGEPPASADAPVGDRALLLACGAAGVGLAVHGLVEVPVINTMMLYMALVTAALAAGSGWQVAARPAASSAHSTATPRRGLLAVHPLHTVLVLAALLAWGSGFLIVWLRSANEDLQTAARAALQQGDAAEALVLYDDSLERYPWDRDAYPERATVLAWLALDNPDLLPDAIDAQATAARINPAHRRFVPINQAALLMQMGDTDQAETLLREAIDADVTRWPVPRVLLAHLLEQTGRTDAAVPYWQQALDREPAAREYAACLHSTVCSTLPIDDNEYLAVVTARHLAQQPDAAALSEIERLASAWRSVDIWAIGARAAQQADAPDAAQRFLQGALDEAQNVAKEPTEQLAIALLYDALAREDEAALRGLIATWLDLPEPHLVPQVTYLLVTPTDAELARTLLTAADYLEDPVFMQQARIRLAMIQAALPETAAR
jgi:tetratricopeptide (TPR) repeat protein